MVMNRPPKMPATATLGSTATMTWPKEFRASDMAPTVKRNWKNVSASFRKPTCHTHTTAIRTAKANVDSKTRLVS